MGYKMTYLCRCSLRVSPRRLLLNRLYAFLLFLEAIENDEEGGL